jgi:putative intracellular protease/amidase
MLMKLRYWLWGILGAVGLFLIGGGAWILTLPPAKAAAVPPAIAKEEADATLAALKPKRERPVVAIIGINDATEVTDYLMPYGILKRADVAEVLAVATGDGPVSLYPALKVEPDTTVAAFDAKYPDGADFVIVPAMSRDDDPAVMEWLKQQAAKGAAIIGVCAGAKVVAAAGLLDGKRGTTHWYYLKELRGKHPAMTYVADRRIVADRGVVTTTGISASMPLSLTLIEAVAGRGKAEAVARGLGLSDWDARHDSGAFQFTRSFALTAIGNSVAFWNYERLGIELTPGIDEVSLALIADAWSRTFKSRAITFAKSDGALTTKNGLRVIPDRAGSDWPGETTISITGQAPAKALDETLRDIGARYGEHTATFVAIQLEYPARAYVLP